MSPQWIFKIVQSLMDSGDKARLQLLIQEICTTSWHINYAKSLLEETYNISECRALVLTWIWNMMSEAKKEITDKFDMIESVLCHTLYYFRGKATLGPVVDLRNQLIKTFGLEAILELCTEKHLVTDKTGQVLRFLPAYLHPFMPQEHFKMMAKKAWKDNPMAGIRYCIDLDVAPSDIKFLLHGLKGKPLLDLVLYVVRNRKIAYIEYFNLCSEVVKNMKILTQYVLRCPNFCVQTFMSLDYAFKFVNQEPCVLIHVCLAKSIPEPVVRHVISKCQFEKRLSVDDVYVAALNPIYSDDFIVLLISHSHFDQFAGKLVRKLEEGSIKRGDAFIALLMQMASAASRLSSRLSPKYF
jgi:hypothetical protein